MKKLSGGDDRVIRIVQKKTLTYVNDGTLHTVGIQPVDGSDTDYLATIPEMNFADLYIE